MKNVKRDPTSRISQNDFEVKKPKKRVRVVLKKQVKESWYTKQKPLKVPRTLITRPNQTTTSREGRKSKINDYDMDMICRMAERGLTDEEICKVLKINVTTYWMWMNHQKFSNAIKKGREAIDDRVERSLLKRALGLQIIEETKEPVLKLIYDKNKMILRREYELKVSKRVKKQLPADVGAAKMWLSNRRGSEWRESNTVVNNTNTLTAAASVNNQIQPDDIDDDTRSRIARNMRIIRRHRSTCAISSA